MIVYSRETVPKYTFGVVGFFAKRIRISWINLKARKKVVFTTLKILLVLCILFTF